MTALWWILGVFAFVMILYLFLIMPSLKRPDSTKLQPRLYAHRGLHDGNVSVSENGLKAFSLAATAGYGIEFDVQLSKDGRLMVFHDDTLLRVTGASGRLCDMTYEQIRANPLPDGGAIPTLDEALALIDGRVPIIVEIKHHGSVLETSRATMERLKKYMGPYCVESFHPLAVRYFKKNAPEVLRGQLASGVKLGGDGLPWYQHFAMKYLLLNAVSRPHFVAYDISCDHNLSVRLMKSLFRPLLAAWTISDKRTLDYARRDYQMPIFERFNPND